MLLIKACWLILKLAGSEVKLPKSQAKLPRNSVPIKPSLLRSATLLSAVLIMKLSCTGMYRHCGMDAVEVKTCQDHMTT